MIAAYFENKPDRRETSAAAQPAPHDAKLLREQCLMLLQQHDLTADECAEMLCKSVLSVRPRFSELAKSGIIFALTKRETINGESVVVTVTRKNASGKSAIVWTTKSQGSFL